MNTTDDTNAARRGSGSNDLLGPPPEADMRHQKARDDLDEEESYSAEAMDAERRRCYALGVSTERERCAKLCDELHAEMLDQGVAGAYGDAFARRIRGA